MYKYDEHVLLYAYALQQMNDDNLCNTDANNARSSDAMDANIPGNNANDREKHKLHNEVHKRNGQLANARH